MQYINNILFGKSWNGHHWDYSITGLDGKSAQNLPLRRTVQAVPAKAEDVLGGTVAVDTGMWLHAAESWWRDGREWVLSLNKDENEASAGNREVE